MTTSEDAQQQRGTVRIYQAIKPDGSALWPEMRPLEWIAQQRAGTPTPFFNAQYQNDPSGLSGVRYDIDWLNYYLPAQLPPLQTLIGVQGADPATSESSNANYFGHCTVGKDPNSGIIYVLSFAFDNLAAPKHEAFLRLQYSHWRTQGLTIRQVRKESHGPIQAATQHLELENRQARTPMPLEIVKPKGSKEERFDELYPHLGNGTILFPGQRGVTGKIEMKEDTGFDEFKSEFTSFPIGKRDDLMDALWIAVDGLLGSSPAAAVAEEDRVPPSGGLSQEDLDLLYTLPAEEWLDRMIRRDKDAREARQARQVEEEVVSSVGTSSWEMEERYVERAGGRFSRNIPTRRRWR